MFRDLVGPGASPGPRLVRTTSHAVAAALGRCKLQSSGKEPSRLQSWQPAAWFRIPPMSKLTIVPLLLWISMAPAQEKEKQEHKPPPAPPVRVNILNVCTPSEGDQKEIAAALTRIPQRPGFGPDYEVSRGHTTADDGSGSDWVRIRREYLKDAPVRAVQFSFSVDTKDNREVAVFYSRDTKDVLQVSLEDKVAAGTNPATVLASDPPVSHIRLERYGKPSLLLAR